MRKQIKIKKMEMIIKEIGNNEKLQNNKKVKKKRKNGKSFKKLEKIQHKIEKK